MIIRSKNETSLTDTFIKVVVDIRRNILALGCELHSDCADELIQDGSKGNDLWGANLYPQKNAIAFVSLINIRPQDGNRSMELQLPELRSRVEQIIRTLVMPL